MARRGSSEQRLEGDSDKVRPIKGLTETDPFTVNLAAKLPEETLTAISDLVFRDFEDDWDSGSGWREKHADWVALYYQQDKPIAPPWSGSSTESLPILTEACNQFQARAYRAFFPSRLPLVGLVVGKKTTQLEERAERVGRHMSWELMVKDRNYKRDKAALLLSVPLHGSVFTETVYDPLWRKKVVRNVPATSLVVPYRAGAIAIEDLDRSTEIVPTTVNETRIRTQAGYFTKPAEPYKDGEDRPTQLEHDDAHGQSPSSMSDDTAMLLKQDRLLDLDGDGIQEPYRIWVDKQSREVLRVEIRYEAQSDGTPTDAKRPICYYTHYQCLPNPDGFYGLGFGHLLGPPNSAINKMLRQFIDAGTLATAGNMSGIISNTITLNKGEMQLKLGKFIGTDASAEEVSKGIKTFTFPGPSDAMLKALQMLDNRAQRLSTVTDVVAGESEKVLQPTTVMELVDQSQQIFSSIQEFLLESWTDELSKIYRLNRLYFDGEEYFTVNGPKGLEEMVVASEDYAEDMLVIPVADPRMANSRQKMQKADALWKFATTNPLMANDPMALVEASKRVLEAMEIPDYEKLLPSVLPPTPDRYDDQQVENMFFMMPPEQRPLFAAFPDQDHVAHLEEMAAFEATPYFKAVDMAAWQVHRQQHMAYQYGLEQGILTPDMMMAAQQGGGGVIAGNQAQQPGGAGAPQQQAGGAMAGGGGPGQPGGMAQAPGKPASGGSGGGGFSQGSTPLDGGEGAGGNALSGGLLAR
jgi:chaperonin GroES